MGYVMFFAMRKVFSRSENEVTRKFQTDVVM